MLTLKNVSAKMGTSSSMDVVGNVLQILSMTSLLAYAETSVESIKSIALLSKDVYANQVTISSQADARNAQVILSLTPS